MLLAMALQVALAFLNAQIFELQQTSVGVFVYNAGVKIDQM